MPPVQPAALYLGLVALLVLRYMAGSADQDNPVYLRRWGRDVGIAVGMAVAGHLVSAQSPLMSVLLLVAYLTGFMVLTIWLFRRFGDFGGSTFAGRVLVIMVCLLVAMVAMALPILFMAKQGVSGGAALSPTP